MKQPALFSALFLLAALAFAFIGAPSSVQARTWTQAATGKTIEAKLVKVENGTAHLRLASGQIAEVKVSSLSVDDQAFLEKSAASTQNATSSASGGNWPAFRGPEGTGISPDSDLLDTWPEDGPEQLWVYEDAGMGYSGFSVVGGKLYTMGTRDEDFVVICIDTADGKEAWSTNISEDDQEGYNVGWGHGPRSTPTVSDGRVYALDAKGGLFCLDAETGKEEWSRDLVKDFQGKAGGWGYAASPLVDGDRVVVAPGGQEAGIVCLDKKTGKDIWQATDVTPGKAEYATIVPCDMNGTRLYVRLFEKEIVAVSAEDGDLVWSSEWPNGKVAVIPTPIVDGNQVYVSSGYGAGSKLLEVSDDNETKDLWENKTMKNHHGGVVKFGDHLYGFSDGAGLICQDWDSGELVWNEKGRYTTKGAVHIADGKIYALNEDDGTVTLAEASPEGYEQKGRFTFGPQSENRNPKGKIWVHPLVVDGKLYLRDQEFLVAYDVRGE